MPEHETFDLDTAFSRLEQDISTLSSAPGAGLAVARARRRRRTTIGAVAAVAVVAVGGAALAQGVGSRDHAVVPADHLPVPAPLDGPHLTAATSGWTPAWSAPSDQVKLELSNTFGGPCLPNIPSGDTGGITVLGTSDGGGALALMNDYGTDAATAQRAWSRVERQMAACGGSEEVSAFSDPSGAEGHTYRIDPRQSGTPAEYVWVVSTGKGIGVLKIFGHHDPLPSTNDRPVADALLAAVQAPQYYDNAATGSVSSSGTVGISVVDFADALDGWQSGWSATSGDEIHAATSPCGVDLTEGEQYGSSTSLGANGELGTIGFTTQAVAKGLLQEFGQRVRTCASATYDAHSVSLQGGSVTVLAGTGPDAPVVWLVQDGRQLGYVSVPAGSTTPPDSVSEKVGDLISSTLRANQASITESAPAASRTQDATPAH